MIKNKRFLMLASAALVGFPLTVVQAATTSINATATFIAALTLSGTNMQFAQVQYGATPTAGSYVRLGTNGSATYGGTFSAGSGTPVAGDVTVTAGTNGQTVEVRCDSSAIMTNGSGASITVNNIRAAAENSTAAYTTGNCAGISGAAATTMVLNMGTLDSFKFGGQIDGGTAVAFASGSYSTANTGGDNLAVAVTYQ